MNEVEKKEIDEMANVLAKACPDKVEDNCGGTPCIVCLAEKLYNAGYRKVENCEQEKPFKITVPKKSYKQLLEEMASQYNPDEILIETVDVEAVKKQAIKEFAEKLRDKLQQAPYNGCYEDFITYNTCLDDLLKEYGI